MSKQKIYIDTEGNDYEAYREAMQAACELAKKDPTIKRVVLLISTKGSDGWFGKLYGSETVKDLYKGTKFEGCSPLYKFETLKTYKDSLDPSDIVITCGLDSDDVLKIDDYYSAKIIIAIPWLKKSLNKWVQTWAPTELRGKAAVAVVEPSCIVKKAMAELTESVNMTTGINHPSDEEHAKTTILSLYKYESSIDANIVGAYLVRELGWDTEHAKDVEKLISTLNAGKFFKGGQRTGLQHWYNRWKEECQNDAI